MAHYILDGKTPVEVDLITWGRQFEEADRTVKKTEIDEDVTVSTVFLGLDRQFGNGPPLIFETMVFGGEFDEQQRRYSTWDEAIEGHNQVVRKIRATGYGAIEPEPKR